MTAVEHTSQVSGDPISGLLMEGVEPDTGESAFVDDGSWGFGASDDPDGVIVGAPDEAPVGPPDRAVVGSPDREDPEVAAKAAFLAWWDANAQYVTDDAELIGLLEWRAKVHLEIVRRLYANRLGLLIEWRSGGMTLQQIAARSGLSYARVYELMPKHLRGRRPVQDQCPDAPNIGGPDKETIGGPDSEPVAA